MSPRPDDDSEDDGTTVPESPHSPEITDFDADSVQLKWKESPADGGAPITWYLIEYKESKDEEWTEGPKTKPKKFLSEKVAGLNTGAKYEFRVKALNRNGQSSPSEATTPQVIKAQKEAPKIDRKVMVDEKSCKVNQQMVLEVPVAGAPFPETVWLKDGEEVQPTDMVKVSHANNMAKLLFIPAKRDMRGKYTLKAKNQYGEDEAGIEINVYGKPEAPRGPIEITDVTKKTCNLAWVPPKDNGGRSITHYEIEKLDPNLGQWLPVGQTKGTSFAVRNLVEGKEYKFLVRAVNQEGDSPDLESEETIVAKNPFDPPGKPDKPEVVDWGQDFAELKWKAPTEDGGAEVTMYRVEIRNRDKRAWHTAGTTKETGMRVGEGIEYGNEYEFKVYAVNKGGESEASPTSNPIIAKPRFIKPKINRDILPGEKTIYASQILRMEVQCTAEPAADFTWLFPNGGPVSADLRCDVESEANRSQLTMEEVSRADAGLFKVIAKNSEGMDEVELRINVVSPPSQPLGPLEITDVRPTSCKLAWRKPLDDGGSPINAYSIERKDVERDAWMNCGKITGKMMAVMKNVDFDVSGLLEGAVYMFRVCAGNAQGEGEPLESKIPVVAKAEKDPPGQPYKPRVEDWDKKWAKLEWDVMPGNDDVTHYVVEMQEQFMVPKDMEEEAEEAAPSEGGEEPAPKMAPPPAAQRMVSFTELEEFRTNWMVALITDDNTTEAKITDLTENNKYRFRIKAVNGAGQSVPSEPSKEIVCKVRRQWPEIDCPQANAPVRVSNGQTITLSAKVKGEPVPKKTWYFGKIECKGGPSVSIVEKDYSTKMIMHNAQHQDTGTYAIKAENMHGEKTLLLDVVVMVPPSKPKGPMKIFDIYAEGCTCEWGEPEDNGGSPILYYIVERSDGTFTTWTPCGRSETTSCAVMGLQPDKNYRLQVKAMNSEGESIPLEGVDAFITENPFGPPGAPGRPVLVESDSDYLEVKWDPPKHDGGSRITGYQIEHRLWKETAWVRSGEVRMQLEKGHAEGTEVGQAYAVRVRAVNAGGEGPWSMESERMECRHKALKPKVIFRADKELTVKVGETLSLHVDVPGEPPAEDVSWSVGDNALAHAPEQGVVVDNTKPYKSMLQIDHVTRKHKGEYKCMAMNMHGKGTSSVTVHVIGKPSIPQDRLEVSDIRANGCRLSWEAPKDDGGLPCEYLVEKYIVSADAWSKQAVTMNTHLEVNDLEVGHEYEFRVKAVNGQGESEPIKTMRTVVAKDKFSVPFPPGPPLVTDWSESSITIEWSLPLDDGGCPITGYHIETKTKGTEGWQLWETIDTPTCTANMVKLQKGLEYQFRVIAINRVGKSEASHPSTPRETRARNLVPYIDVKSLRDVTVVAGDRVKFDLPIFGEPAPDVQWTNEAGDALESTRDRSVMVTTTTSNAKLVFNDIKKSMEGEYAITVTNESGSDAAKFKIHVLDRPESPDGPLSATVEGSQCSLLWKLSKNDGGAPIEHYQVERFEDERGSWLAIGKSKDNTFNAKGLLPGRRYKFRVSAVNKYGDSDPLESAEYVTVGEENVDDAVRNV